MTIHQRRHTITQFNTLPTFGLSIIAINTIIFNTIITSLRNTSHGNGSISTVGRKRNRSNIFQAVSQTYIGQFNSIDSDQIKCLIVLSYLKLRDVSILRCSTAGVVTNLRQIYFYINVIGRIGNIGYTSVTKTNCIHANCLGILLMYRDLYNAIIRRYQIRYRQTSLHTILDHIEETIAGISRCCLPTLFHRAVSVLHRTVVIVTGIPEEHTIKIAFQSNTMLTIERIAIRVSHSITQGIPVSPELFFQSDGRTGLVCRQTNICNVCKIIQQL